MVQQAQQKRIFLSLAVIVLSLFGIYFLFIQGDKHVLRQELVVGTNVGYPPFILTDEGGELVGFDVDVAHAIARAMGKKAVFMNMSFDSLIISLKQRHVDMIIGGLSITPSRREQIALVPYYGDVAKSYSLLFWGPQKNKISSVLDLISQPKEAADLPSVATQVGTSMHEYLEQFADKIVIKTFGDIDDVLMDIRYGKSMMGLFETPVAHALQKKYPELSIVSFSLSEKERIVAGNGIGIASGNKVLIDKVGRIIEQMKSSGELQVLIDKWFVH